MFYTLSQNVWLTITVAIFLAIDSTGKAFFHINPPRPLCKLFGLSGFRDVVHLRILYCTLIDQYINFPRNLQ